MRDHPLRRAGSWTLLGSRLPILHRGAGYEPESFLAGLAQGGGNQATSFISGFSASDKPLVGACSYCLDEVDPIALTRAPWSSLARLQEVRDVTSASSETADGGHQARYWMAVRYKAQSVLTQEEVPESHHGVVDCM